MWENTAIPSTESLYRASDQKISRSFGSCGIRRLTNLLQLRRNGELEECAGRSGSSQEGGPECTLSNIHHSAWREEKSSE